MPEITVRSEGRLTGGIAHISAILYIGHNGWTCLDERMCRNISLQKALELYLAKQKGPNLYVHILDAIKRPFLDS